jgi:hypothetical protein
MKLHAAMIFATLAWFAPRVASACPYCASRPSGGIGQSLAIGIFIAVPFVVAAAVYRFIQSGEQRSPSSRKPLGDEASIRRG